MEKAQEEQRKRQEEQALAIQQMKESVEACQDSLSEAIALLLKAQAEKKSSRRRRPQPPVVEEDSSNESSDEEDCIPVPPRKKKQKGNKRKGARPAAQPDAAPKEYKLGKKYRPGMAWDPDWPKIKKDAYYNARQEFHSTGTKEAIRDKIEGIKRALKTAQKNNLTRKGGQPKKALAKWTKELDDE